MPRWSPLGPRLALLGLLGACSSTGAGGDAITDPPRAPSSSSDTTATAPSDPQVGDPKDTPADEPWNPPVESGAVSFPYTAYRCGYAVRQVSPAKPTASFHEDAGSAAPKNLHLTIAGNAASSVVVQWATDDATRATQVRFGDSPTSLDKVATGYSFTYGVTNRREHEVHLCGLQPGRTYYYDAGGPKARSKIASFTTAPDAAADVKVLVIGDTRSNPSVLKGMEAAALAQGASVMVLTGDAVATGGTQSQWDALYASAPDLFAQIPGVWAHGNHEDLDELYFAQHALPDNGGASGIEEWFALTYGAIRLVVLNDTVSSSAQISGVERSFLDTVLKAVDRTRTPFVVTMHHKPMYTTSSNHGSDTTLRAQWAPLFEQYHVHADLAGHVHSYESTKPIKAEAIASDAEGTRYFNFGGGGAPLYGFGSNRTWMQTRESVHGFAVLSVSGATMKWNAYRADGSMIESIAIPK